MSFRLPPIRSFGRSVGNFDLKVLQSTQFLLCGCFFSGLRLKQDFFGLVEQQYGVRPKALPGGSKDVKEINDWVAQETGGKVQRFLAKALPRSPFVNTVSAAYFKGASGKILNSFLNTFQDCLMVLIG